MQAEVVRVEVTERSMFAVGMSFGAACAYERVKGRIEKRYATKTPNFRCAGHVDFRDMLEQEKSINAVLMATPDHLHAHASVIAMRTGKAGRSSDP